MQRIAVAILLLLAAPVAGQQWGNCPGGSCPPGSGYYQPLFPQQPQQPTAPASGIVAASVRVQWNNSSGSGTCIYDDGTRAYVLTCKHVVEGPGSITVTFPGINAKFAGAFLASDQHADLALVYIKSEGQPRMLVATSSPPAGTNTTLVGYPGGRGPRSLNGRVNGYMPQPRGIRHMAISQASISGDSGGGVFANGELVGVLWGGSGRDGTAVELADIRRFTEQCLPGFARPRPSPPSQQPIIAQPPAQPQPIADGRLDLLMTKIETALVQIAEIRSRPPQPGPAGLPGPPGERGGQGPVGPQGPPGKNADEAALRAEIATLRAEMGALRASFNSLSGIIRIRVEEE